MKRKLLILLLSALPAVYAVGQSSSDYEGPSKGNKKEKSANADKKDSPQIYTGFSGGMQVHLGYGFAKSANQLYGNASDHISGLQKDGIMIGIGGLMRVHMLDHIRLGVEGYFSTMPLHNNSSVRMGWGGPMLDAYMTWKTVRPFVGLGLGGGAIQRTYVEQDIRAKEPTEEGEENDMVYNASFTKSSFFYLDPTIGLDIILSKSMSMTIRMDYLLPFGKNRGITEGGTTTWGSFLSPNGPRFYLGFVFDHSAKKSSNQSKTKKQNK